MILGQGNVALDVARTLLRDVNSLRTTDMTDHALDTLSKSRVKKVRIVGRRGPMQVCAFVSSMSEKAAHMTNPTGIFYDQRGPGVTEPPFSLFRAH